jgi:hypothetical protein
MSTADTKPLTAAPAGQQVPVARHLTPRTVVGALWLFVTLNYLYCDVLSNHDPVYLNKLLTGTVDGVVFTQPMLLASSVLVSIPMVAVLISRIAPHALARWYSVVAGVIMAVVQVSTMGFGSAPTLHYLYFSAIEIATTAFIAWFAVSRWRVDN